MLLILEIIKPIKHIIFIKMKKIKIYFCFLF